MLYNEWGLLTSRGSKILTAFRDIKHLKIKIYMLIRLLCENVFTTHH